MADKDIEDSRSLFKGGRFLPLFATQFLGAFNDNIYRSAFLLVISFGQVPLYGMKAGIIASLSLAFFILPFFLLSAFAGGLADRTEKSRFILYTKIGELVLALLAFAAYQINNLFFLMIVLAGLGVQSAFFGPVKFSIIPALVRKNRLLEANGYVDAGTFLAILTGTLLGSSLIILDNGRFILPLVMIGVSAFGLLAAFFIPAVAPRRPAEPLEINIFKANRQVLHFSFSNPIIRYSILGAAWIWLLGSVYLSQIPILGPVDLKGDESVFILLLVLFSVGIGIGSIAVNWILKGKITSRLTVKALIMIMLASIGFYGCLVLYQAPVEGLTLIKIVEYPIVLLALFLLLVIAVCGGGIIVPLYTLMQYHSPVEQRSRVMASNNIVNAGFMATGSIASAIMVSAGLSSKLIITLVALTGVFLIWPLAKMTK